MPWSKVKNTIQCQLCQYRIVFWTTPRRWLTGQIDLRSKVHLEDTGHCSGVKCILNVLSLRRQREMHEASQAFMNLNCLYLSYKRRYKFMTP